MIQLSLALTSERAETPAPRLPGRPPRSRDPDRPAMWTGVNRCVRGGSYFRFYWQQLLPSGKWTTRYLSIRGGNSESELAIANRALVDAAIAEGQSLLEIKLLCRSFQRQTGNYNKSFTDGGAG